MRNKRFIKYIFVGIILLFFLLSIVPADASILQTKEPTINAMDGYPCPNPLFTSFILFYAPRFPQVWQKPDISIEFINDNFSFPVSNEEAYVNFSFQWGFQNTGNVIFPRIAIWKIEFYGDDPNIPIFEGGIVSPSIERYKTELWCYGEYIIPTENLTYKDVMVKVKVMGFIPFKLVTAEKILRINFID